MVAVKGDVRSTKLLLKAGASMKKLILLFVVVFSGNLLAKDDCSSKNNFLQYLHSEFYKEVKITMLGKQKMRDPASSVRLRKDQVVKIVDIDVIDDKYFQIIVEDEKENLLPMIEFHPKKGVSPYKATIADLESTGKYKVNCDMISYSDHETKMGRVLSRQIIK